MKGRSKTEEIKFLEETFSFLDTAEQEIKALGQEIKALTGQIAHLREIREKFIEARTKTEERVKSVIVKLEAKLGDEK